MTQVEDVPMSLHDRGKTSVRSRHVPGDWLLESWLHHTSLTFIVFGATVVHSWAFSSAAPDVYEHVGINPFRDCCWRARLSDDLHTPVNH